ncbi:MAG TPA: TonB-dependent receptor [Verrucomicrobiae bacterium]|jgi:iron complex outermembrane receptor protein
MNSCIIPIAKIRAGVRFTGLLITTSFLIISTNASLAQTDVSSASANIDTNSPSALKELSLEQLMNMDVTSVTREPEPYKEAPASIDLITSDEIGRSGASSIPEALRLADNLDVAQKNSHDWAISARGFNTSLANKLLVLVDGRTVYTPLFAGVYWDQQDYILADIDHIEVISGPGGTLWGANAVNGVINITTKSAEYTQGLYVDGGGGSWLRDFGGARYGGVLASNVYYRIYGKYSGYGSEVLPNGNSANDSWNMGQGGFRIDDVPLSPNAYTLQGDFNAGHENVTTGGRANVFDYNLLGRWTHTLSDDSDMQLQAYFYRTHLTDPIPASFSATTPPILLAPTGTLIDDLTTFDLDFQHRLHLGARNNFVWGAGYRRTAESDQSDSGLAFNPPTLDQNLYSFFVQDQIKLLENLHLTFGTKVEHNDYTGFEEEPSGRLQWDVTKNQMAWVAVSRAVRMPSRVDEAENERVTTPPFNAIIPSILVGNSNFVSETLIAFEAGYRAQLGQKVSSSVSVFYNLYNDIRSAQASPPPAPLGFPFIFENNLKGETYGTELAGDYQILNWWRLHAGYDLLKENIYVKSGQTDINAAHNETADPQQQVFFRSSMDLPANVQFDTSLRWIDSITLNSGAALETIPSYFELDARLGWQVTKNIEVAVVGQNLLHAQHQEYGYPSSASTENIVRSGYGEVTCRF